MLALCVLAPCALYYTLPLALHSPAHAHPAQVIAKRVAWMPDSSAMKTTIDARTISAYTFHNWCQRPSGEKALKHVLLPGAFARRPLCERLVGKQRPNMGVSFIYGDEHDWMDRWGTQSLTPRLDEVRCTCSSTCRTRRSFDLTSLSLRSHCDAWRRGSAHGRKVAAELRALGQQATVTVIPEAGHQVFLDQPAPFCAALLRELEPYYDGGGG